MIAKREVWNYAKSTRVWVGKYKNSHNLLHWHYDCELLYVEHGVIDIFCEKKAHRLTNGELLYIDSGQVHYMRAVDPETRLIVIIFDYDLVKGFLGDVRLANAQLSGTYPIEPLYRELRALLKTQPPYFGVEAACKVVELMLSVFRNEQIVPREKADTTSRRFKDLLGDINERCEYYTFGEAVSFMGMSDAYFSRYFRSMTGITFSQYLNYVRIDRAIALLRGKNAPTSTEIAGRCGFGTIRNYNRIFRELTGYAPTALPPDYVLQDTFYYPSEAAFDPTLYDCELIESGQA